MKCTGKEWDHCRVEKMGCEGCYYNEDNDRDIEELKTLFYSDKLTQYGKRKFIEYYEQRIKACKELEYKYNKALSDLVQAEHKNKELEEEKEALVETVSQLTKENSELKDIIREHTLLISPYYVAQNYIPVSLVEEAIEEIKNETWYIDSGEEAKQSCVEVLQKLLEKR